MTHERPTVDQIIYRWFELNSPGWTQSTIDNRRWVLSSFIIPRWGEEEAEGIDPVDLSRWFNADLTNVSEGTRDLVLRIFRAAMNFAVREEMITRSPLKSVKLARTHKEQKSPPDASELAEAIESVQDQPWRNLAITAALTGLRRGEIAGLRWRDVGEGRILVSRSIVGTSKGAIVKGPKSERSRRRIAVGPALQQLLNKMYAERRTACIINKVEPMSETYVFSKDPTGRKPLDPRSITKWWAKCRPRPDMAFHDLRHWGASEMLAAGVDPITVASRLGHDPAVLMETYAHLMPSRDVDAAAKVESILGLSLD